MRLRTREEHAGSRSTPDRLVAPGHTADVNRLAILVVSAAFALGFAGGPPERKPNRLIREKSPYLLQHAYNPVDWYPWGSEALERARRENKPIFLSIGYSTCYWCHVMEREVFENADLAALINRTFVAIKVDREERPDLDRIYMAALHALAGSGGWPMSLVLAPDRTPFFGASYIPPDRFRQLAERIGELWSSRPEDLRRAGRELAETLARGARMPPSGGVPQAALLDAVCEGFRRTYDPEHFGFGVRLKFPRPAALDFLLRHHARTGDRRALRMVLDTLGAMRAGGIHDQLEGGFHRYSVDAEWRVPHFEKMLYDQAQLVGVYADAYRVTRDPALAAVVRRTLGYVLARLTSPEGGFYTAEDAESATEAARPDVREEGAYYVWRLEEIERVLGAARAPLFVRVHGVRAEGNALEDPRNALAGRNVLFLARAPGDVARELGRPAADAEREIEESRRRLAAARAERPRPRLDDKILAGWNGLMISAAARASQALGEPSYLRAAERAAELVWRRMWDPKSRRLARRYRAGEAGQPAGLQDYAFCIVGLLDLYETSLDFRWLERAVDLARAELRLFEDPESGGFFDTAAGDDSLLLRTRDDYDGAEPAGNSVAALGLLRLAESFRREEWKRAAERTLALFRSRIEQQPDSMPALAAALDFHLSQPLEIVIAGPPDRADVRELLGEVHRRFLPNKVVLSADGGAGQRWLARSVPFLASVRRIDGRAAAYVCRDFACKLPTADRGVLAAQLGPAPAR
jgi:uncharacterized protein YyaL (SSP411 family)